MVAESPQNSPLRGDSDYHYVDTGSSSSAAASLPVEIPVMQDISSSRRHSVWDMTATVSRYDTVETQAGASSCSPTSPLPSRVTASPIEKMKALAVDQAKICEQLIGEKVYVSAGVHHAVEELVLPIMEQLKQYAAAQERSVKLSQHEFNRLPVSITVTREGQVFIHFKERVARGQFKQLKTAFELTTGRSYVKATPVSEDPSSWGSIGQDMKKEVRYYKALEGVAGIAQGRGVMVLSASKKGGMKPGLFLERYDTNGKDYLSTLGSSKSKEEQIRIKAEMIKQLVNGLGEMHQLGMYHRDLKMDNVLVKEEEGQLSVGLCDFAQSVDEVGEELCVSGVGDDEQPKYQAGDFSRRPPETYYAKTLRRVARRLQKSSGVAKTDAAKVANQKLLEAADVWAMGMMLCTIVLGRDPEGLEILPFPSDDNPESVAEYHAAFQWTMEKYVQLRKDHHVEKYLGMEKPSDPNTLTALIFEMMAFDPLERPSMDAVKAKISEFFINDETLIRAFR